MIVTSPKPGAMPLASGGVVVPSPQFHTTVSVDAGPETLRLRNNDGYAAWADDKGRMIKLQPLQGGAAYSLVLDGYQKSVENLR